MSRPASRPGQGAATPASARTLVLHHDDCLRHDPGPRHPERTDRVAVVLKALRGLGGCDFLPAPKATPEQVARVHGPHYPALLSEREPGADSAGPVALDPDTFLSAGSVDAASRGSGAACFAIDEIYAGRARNAFCVTRPPGHHAETATAMGFCLFNHAAIAARHALAEHGAKRVAILDFDVHHGNGTQAIFESSPEVFFASSHQMPLYPGTGAAAETGVGNIHNLPLAPGDGSRAFRRVWSRRALPALIDFAPDLIIVSAGFDAHRRDPLGQLELEDADFSWITEQLRAIAETTCAARLVSILEGGYDLEALASAARAHVGVLAA